MRQQYLVSVESRYLVKASSETEASAFALAAASCCGIVAPGIADRVDASGSDLICCTLEESTTAAAAGGT